MRQGTIDGSPEYKEFLASLSQVVPTEPVVSGIEDGPKTTPLIEYLRTQKATRAEKERLNREKARLAKIAVVQAKANAQSSKLRAEKLQKTDAASKTVDKDVRRPVAKGGAAKSREAQRSRGPTQLPKSLEKNSETPVTGGSETPVVRMPPRNAPVQTIESPTEANGSGGRGFRGRGRGGRARPVGVYRPGGGRGGRRGGGGGDAMPVHSVAEG